MTTTCVELVDILYSGTHASQWKRKRYSGPESRRSRSHIPGADAALDGSGALQIHETMDLLHKCLKVVSKTVH